MRLLQDRRLSLCILLALLSTNTQADVLLGRFDSIQDVRRKAESNDPQAQYILGSAFATGWEVERDQKTAVEWFRKSAEGGSVEGQIALGVCYWKGLGVDVNLAEAATWFKKAEAQDSIAATSFLKQLDSGHQLPSDTLRGKLERFFNGTTKVKDEVGFTKEVLTAQWIFEQIHPIGKAKKVEISSLVRNTDSSGKLESVGLELLMFWEGPLQKGTTTLRLLYDVKEDEFKHFSVVRTDGITKGNLQNFASAFSLAAKLGALGQ